MSILIPAKQEQWLRAQVGKGVFASVDDAVAHLIAVEMALEDDDLALAKAAVEEGRASAARGEVVTVDASIEEIADHLAKLRSR